MPRLLACVAVLLASPGVAPNPDPAVVELANGALLKGYVGDGYRLFQAVPYAEKPERE